MMLEQLRLMLITDSRLAGAGMLEKIRAALDGGVTAVQLREPGFSTQELFNHATALRRMTTERGAALIVNDRVDVALAVGADGVQLGWRSLEPAVARKLAGPRLWLGCSVHNRDEARRAAAYGVEYLLLGPVFPTPSKAGLIEVLGLEQFADIAREVRQPVLGVGGIDAANCASVLRAGACGVALIRGLLNADDPAAAAAAIRGGGRAARVAFGANPAEGNAG